jgi:PKD repeat protein
LDDSDGFTIYDPVSGNAGYIEIDPDASIQGEMVYVSLVIEDINTGCDSTIGRWMYIPQTPNPDFAGGAACVGDVSQFSNLSTMPGPNVMAFKWRFGDPNATDDSAESKIGVWHYSTYGTFDVTLEVVYFTYPKFVYEITKQVIITPTPDVAFQVVNACEGTDIEFINGTTLPLPGTISYEWNFGDGSAISTQTNPSHLYASSKAEGYLVTLKAEANGCVSELTKKAYQFATPVADFSTNGACNLEDISFINETSIAIGKSGYNWDFGDGGISTAKDPKHAFSTPGTKSVTLSAFSEFGCEDQITLDVELLESPEADFEIDQACNLTPVNFTRTGSIPGTANDNDFQWNFNGQSGSSLENPSFLFSDVGEKEITLTISSLNGCTSTVTKEINVVLQAVADFSVEDICEGVPAVFINKSSVSAGDLTYKWYLGNGDSSDHVNPSYDYEVLGNTRVVNITLRAVVEGGCNAEISKPLTINAAPDATFGSVKDGRFVQLDGPSGMTAYAWRFGDGSKSTDEDPIYEYQNVDQGSFVICLSVMNDMCWSEYCETVSVDLVGVEDLSRDAEIEVYPNPSTGVFTVEVSEASDDVLITVVDVLGNEIPLTVVDNMDGSYVIDMSNVAAGVYIVQVKNGDSYATKRITVTR